MALLTGTGVAAAASLRLRGVPELVLAAYVLAFAEIVGLTLLLSAFGAVTQSALLVGLGLLLAAALAAWLRLGAPRLPALAKGCVRELRRIPVLVALAAVVGLALAYVVALIVGTPPNNWDSLTYHLARAAFWSQADGVGHIANAYDERLNLNPPNGEIALTFVLEVTRNERAAGFLQFAAALGCAVGIFAIARKLGLARGAAAFGALLFLTLPIVILQASTTQNDLVAASFLVAATVFLLGDSRRELALAAVATALAVATKIPAAFGVPVLGAVAVAATPTSFRTRRLIAVLVGAAAGSYWYIANLVRTGHPLGDLPDTTGLVAFLEPKENLLAAYARILDAFDLSGSVGADIYLYLVVAIVVAVASLLALRDTRTQRVLTSVLTGLVIAAPLALIPVTYVLWRVFAKLHDLLGEPDGTLPAAGWQRQSSASETYSWFGPLGLLLVVGVGVAAAVLVRRRALPTLALILAAAPLAWLVLLSLSIGYDPWQGRFFIFPVALSASLWGIVLHVRVAATAAVAIAATTAALSLVHYIEKPSGLRLLASDTPYSVWKMKRWEAQSVLRSELTPVLRSIEMRLSEGSEIALALGEDDFGYPPFGAHLERRVDLVPDDSGGRGAPGAAWLLANSARAPSIDRDCWRPVLTIEPGWTLFRRALARCDL